MAWTQQAFTLQGVEMPRAIPGAANDQIGQEYELLSSSHKKKAATGVERAPSIAAAPANHVLVAILRPERPTSSGTASTVKVPVNAP
jgi:hypothetical protein